MMPKAGYRGQPILMLVAVLGSWVAARAAMWHPELGDSPPPPGEDADASPQANAPRKVAALARVVREVQAEETSSAPAQFSATIPADRTASLELAAAREIEAATAIPDPQAQLLTAEKSPSRDWAEAAPVSGQGDNPAFAAQASFDPSDVSGPNAGAQFQTAAFAAAPFPPATPSAPGSVPRKSRWSGDFWLLLREDTTTAVTSGRGSYGQSQVGAVLRFDLLPSSDYRPTAYLRASQALAGADESEVAAGLAARPIPSVPITLAAELRTSIVNGDVELRPAAFAYTELAPCDLPLGFTAEAYVQAGYVGGDFATAFADGQLRAEREVVRLGPATLSAGGGSWGGAQKGAERLDIGPAMTFKIDAGAAAARLSLDWRFRVAGDAEPSSGPALTISAGF